MPSVAGLVIPTEATTLVVPAASVAEIVSRPTEIYPLPAVESWVLGYFRWRNCPVTLVSFDRLATDRETAGFTRACVFYPLPGRGPADFFALVVNGDPRGLEITDSAAVDSPPAQILPRFAAGALRVNERTLVIPDFDALKAVFYSDEM